MICELIERKMELAPGEKRLTPQMRRAFFGIGDSAKPPMAFDQIQQVRYIKEAKGSPLYRIMLDVERVSLHSGERDEISVATLGLYDGYEADMLAGNMNSRVAVGRANRVLEAADPIIGNTSVLTFAGAAISLALARSI